MTKSFWALFGYFVPLLILLSCCPAGAQTDPNQLVIGIVNYQTSSKSERYREIFAKLSSKLAADSSPKKIEFRLVFGTYDEVVDWFANGHIHGAIATPGVYSSIKRRALLKQNRPIYLATECDPKLKGDSRTPGTYRSCCIVHEQVIKSKTKSDEGWLKDQLRGNTLKSICLVNSLSASGGVIPRDFLSNKTTPEMKIKHLFRHGRCLTELYDQQKRNIPSIAFVSESTWVRAGDLAKKLRKLEIPELDRIEIPDDAFIIRQETAHTKLLRKKFSDPEFVASLKTDEVRFVNLDPSFYADFEERMARVAPPTLIPPEFTELSIKDVILDITHFRETSKQEPRIALVLSGGGAKCSYQVGVVSAIEEALKEHNEEHKPIEIQLVVGTSGGAVNALPIAMGLCKTDDGRERLEEAWVSLEQRSFLKPSLSTRLTFGFLLLGIEFACFWCLLGAKPQDKKWARKTGIAIILIALVQIGIAYLQPGTFYWTKVEWIQYLYILVGSTLHLPGWFMLASGIGLYSRPQPVGDIPIKKRFFMSIAVCSILLLFLATNVLVFQASLFGGCNLRNELVRAYRKLLPENSVRQVSEQTMASSFIAQLQRDLVVTASYLPDPSEAPVQSDVYFYAAKVAAESNELERKGFDLERGHVFDAVAGSSTIYPVFSEVQFNCQFKHHKLVDGGFAHNSPVEAAVDWNATHIILVHASPYSPPGKQLGLWSNISRAYQLMYYQAQMSDRRARQKVPIYSVRPEDWFIQLLDFDRDKIKNAIRRGREQVGTLEGAKPTFRKYISKPRIYGKEQKDTKNDDDSKITKS